MLQRYGISGEMAILPSTRAASGAPAAVAAAGCCCASDGATRSGLTHIGGIVSDLVLAREEDRFSVSNTATCK